MKNLFLIFAFVLVFNVAKSQARKCDLLLTLTSPIEYDFIQTNKPMNVNVSFKNYGPDALSEKDTLIFTLLYDGDSVISAGKPIQKGYIILGGMSVNQEVSLALFSGGVIQNYNVGGVHIYCVDLKLQNRSVTAGCTDPVESNNRSCHHVYVTIFENGIDQYGKSGSIEITPNPANTTANIKYSVADDADVKINITDLQGRTVMEAVNETKLPPGEYQKSIDLTALNSGIYFVSYTIGNKVFTAKLVKQ